LTTQCNTPVFPSHAQVHEMHMHTNCIGVVRWGCNGVVNEEKQPLVGCFRDAFLCH